MVLLHGYVAASPPLGAADTGGQVVYVLELSRKLAQLGYEVDIRTRQFALFADPFDAEDLGITLTKVFRHPRLRTRLSRMGAHKARSLFTWTGIAQQLVATVEHRPAAVVTLDGTEWG